MEGYRREGTSLYEFCDQHVNPPVGASECSLTMQQDFWMWDPENVLSQGLNRNASLPMSPLAIVCLLGHLRPPSVHFTSILFTTKSGSHFQGSITVVFHYQCCHSPSTRNFIVESWKLTWLSATVSLRVLRCAKFHFNRRPVPRLLHPPTVSRHVPVAALLLHLIPLPGFTVLN